MSLLCLFAQLESVAKLLGGHYNPRVIGLRASQPIDTSQPQSDHRNTDGSFDFGRRTGVLGGIQELFLFSVSLVDQIVSEAINHLVSIFHLFVRVANIFTGGLLTLYVTLSHFHTSTLPHFHHDTLLP